MNVGPPSHNNISKRAAHGAIRAYQLTLSGLIGRQCRHAPSCSEFTDEAIARHGLWAGGWMGFARICRCQPWGTHGFDPVPDDVPGRAHWARPWGYGVWRGPLPERGPVCEGIASPVIPDSPLAGRESRPLSRVKGT